MLVSFALVASTTAGRAASAQEPPTADPRKESAQRSSIALGFDPEVARSAQREARVLQADAAELGLRPQDDGSALYVDPHLRFSARFNVDGTVEFADPWRRPDASNERGVCCGRPLKASFPNFEMAGPTEWLMYLSDQEPLRREKALLLERTREFRTGLAIAFARRNIEEALARLESDLVDIWSDPKLTPSARRALLFARWDECDERFAPTTGRVPIDALSVIDRERLAAADQARREIEAFVRRVAPQGSPQGFRSGELSALNDQRQSSETFDPYSPRIPARAPAVDAAAPTRTRDSTAAATPTPQPAKR